MHELQIVLAGELCPVQYRFQLVMPEVSRLKTGRLRLANSYELLLFFGRAQGRHQRFLWSRVLRRIMGMTPPTARSSHSSPVSTAAVAVKGSSVPSLRT